MLPYNASRSRWGTVVVILAAAAFAGIVWKVISGNAPSLPTPSATTGSTSAPSAVVEISMFSSDTKEDWLNSVVDSFNAKQVRTTSGRPITVSVQHGNSGESKDAIVSGVLTPTIWSPGDQSWVGVLNKEWQERHPGQPLIRQACQPTVNAPVGFSMWRPMAEAMGWPAKRIGWNEIVALMADPQGWGRYGHPEWGTFKFGHTDPNSSNSGLLLMTALAYVALDVKDGVTLDMVKSDRVFEAMRTVEFHTYHYGNKSRDNVRRMVQLGPAFLHATNSSEAEALRANQGEYGEGQFKLAFIFPADGTFWAEQPYCVLDADWVTPEQHEAAQLFVDYLHERPQQELAVDNYLRPIDLSVPLHHPFTLDNGTNPDETPNTTPALGSPSPEVIEAVEDLFDRTRKKTTLVLLLDTSQSMNGQKIKKAAEGAAQFVEAMAPDDEIYVYPFGNSVTELQPSGRVGDVGEVLASTLRNIIAGGNTYLNDAVCQAAARVEALRNEDEAARDPRLYGIVVLSDGKNTAGTNSANDVLNTCLPTQEDALGVMVSAIAYGEDADTDFLTRIANRSGGSVYRADEANVGEILLKILDQ